MNTTIAISEETKESLKSFGAKGETYDEILTKVLDWAGQKQLEVLLLDETNTVTIDEAIKQARQKWRK